MGLGQWLDNLLAPQAVSPDPLEYNRPVVQENTKELADNWKRDLDEKLHKHRFNLRQEEKRHTTYDAYGNEDSSWLEFEGAGLTPGEITNKIFCRSEVICERGLGYFWRYVLLEDRNDPRDYFKGWRAFKKHYSPKCKYTSTTYDQGNGWLLYLAHQVIQVIGELKDESLVNVEEMSGEEYEEYCKNILEQHGWQVTVTPKSGDQGIDLIAAAADMSLCIQCKRHSQPVGNSAVQQAFSGKQHYGGTHAAVVTNAGFTQSAKQLAESTGVHLWSTEEFIYVVSDDGDEE